MIKEAKGIGSTVEEAKDKALAALGAGANEDVQIEVLSRPKKKLFGLFGGTPAEVRVFIELPDEKPRRKPNGKKAADNRGTDSAKPEKAPARERKQPESAPAPAGKPTAPAEKTASPAQKSDASAEKAAREAAPAAQPKAVTDPVEEFGEPVDVSQLAEDSPARRAVSYLLEILEKFGCKNITAKVAERDRAALISLDGEDLGTVIGRRGETLDALQYLAGLAANNGGGYYKVSLNFGNYREKREQTLIALASRVSEQVLSSGRSRALEPMNPYERRIIHTAVQGIDGVISSSVGEGSGRRVVIAPEGSEIRAPRRSDDRRGRGSKGGSRGRERRPSNTVATAPTREPKRDTDLPLYGKIN